jgi:hypothetical protein
MEYASNGKGNLATALGATALGIGVLNGGLGNLLGGLGGNNCHCNEQMLVNRYEASQQAEIERLRTEVSLRDANLYSDQKLNDAVRYLENQIGGIKDNLCQQAVVNAQVAANLSCMQGNIATLMGLTKTIVPIGNVCPQPMPQYNSWTAPTAGA